MVHHVPELFRTSELSKLSARAVEFYTAQMQPIWRAFENGTISLDDLEQIDASLRIAAQSLEASVRAQKLRARAKEVLEQPQRPRRISTEKQLQYDNQLPRPVLAALGKYGTDRRVLVVLRCEAGRTRSATLKYAVIATRAMCSRRQAIISCKRLRGKFINWAEQKLSVDFSAPNTFELTDRCYQTWGLPAGAQLALEHGQAARAAWQERVNNGGVQKIALKQGELRNSPKASVEKSRRSRPPPGGRPESGRADAGPRAGDPKLFPDGSLPLAASLTRGERASTVPISGPPVRADRACGQDMISDARQERRANGGGPR